MIVWYNGELKKAGDIKLSIFTHAIHYGTGIFEGIRAYNSKAFKEKEHYERFINSGNLVDVPVQYSVQELCDGTKKVLEENNLTDAYIRPVAWRGDENLGIKSSDNSVQTAIFAWKWNNYFPEEKIKNGINLSQAKFVRPDPRSTEIIEEL